MPTYVTSDGNNLKHSDEAKITSRIKSDWDDIIADEFESSGVATGESLQIV